MKRQSATLRQFARKADRIAKQLDALEMASPRELARKWGTTRDFISKNLPIVKLAPKTHRVRLEDAVAFQQRRAQQLGLTVVDRATKYRGVITSICFDMYGCVQAASSHGIGKTGTVGESRWFDTNRLEILHQRPVMQPPQFDFPGSIIQKSQAER